MVVALHTNEVLRHLPGGGGEVKMPRNIYTWEHSRLGYYFWDKGLKDSGYLGTFRVFSVFTKKWYIRLPEGVLPVASPNMRRPIRASRTTASVLVVLPTQQRQHSSLPLLQCFPPTFNFKFAISLLAISPLLGSLQSILF